MITKTSLGNDLRSSFTNARLYKRVLSSDSAPVEQIIFARKIKTGSGAYSWIRRDMSKMFVDSSPISKSIADNYGTSKGTDVELVFDNTPVPILFSEEKIKDRILNFVIRKDPQIEFIVGDWIEISDFENIEHRRIKTINEIEDGDFLQIGMNIPLDYEYSINYAEMRFLFARTIHNKRQT